MLPLSEISRRVVCMKADVSEAAKQLLRWFLVQLIFDLEDGGDTFLRNIGSHTEYTALYPTIWQHS
jgi:hypothetical protein